MCLKSVVDELSQKPERRHLPLFGAYSARRGVSSIPAVCACGPDEVSSPISP